jgi:hypothetical protein
MSEMNVPFGTSDCNVGAYHGIQYCTRYLYTRMFFVSQKNLGKHLYHIKDRSNLVTMSCTMQSPLKLKVSPRHERRSSVSSRRISAERRAFILDALNATMDDARVETKDEANSCLSDSFLIGGRIVSSPAPISKLEKKLDRSNSISKKSKSKLSSKKKKKKQDDASSCADGSASNATEPTACTESDSWSSASPSSPITRRRSRSSRRSSILVPTSCGIEIENVSPRSSLSSEGEGPETDSPRRRSVTFANFSEMSIVDDICPDEELHETLYYNDNELAEFRHEAFLEKCGLDATYLEIE